MHCGISFPCISVPSVSWKVGLSREELDVERGKGWMLALSHTADKCFRHPSGEKLPRGLKQFTGSIRLQGLQQKCVIIAHILS